MIIGIILIFISLVLLFVFLWTDRYDIILLFFMTLMIIILTLYFIFEVLIL